MTSVQLVLATAITSSVLTAALMYAVFRWLLLPDMETRMRAELEAMRDDFANAVGRSVRKGLRDGVASLPSREVLQDTTRTIARTGIELVGDSLSSWLGGKRGPRSGDQDPPGGGGRS